MDSEFSSISIQRQCLDLMLALADSLERARAAVVKPDLAELRGQTLSQQALCEALQRVLVAWAASRAVRDHKQQPTARAAGEPSQNEFREQLQHIERKVSKLNREYGALLRRASRTINIFCRILAASEITYVPPRQRSSAVECRE